MTLSALASIIALPLVMAGAGLGFGLGYFAALHRTVTLLATQGGWLTPVLLTLGRLSAAVTLLALAVRLGAVSLLAAFAGFLLARAVVLRSLRRVG